METVRTQVSVKTMLSYDYCHFETSMTLENATGVSNEQIDNARKDCMRLCDKAIKQYKIAKDCVAKRTDGKYQIENFEKQCKTIAAKSEHDRTLKEIAMLKQYENENWQEQFEYEYDYDDDTNF